MAYPVGPTFGDQMALVGYTPEVAGDRLRVDLYWLALEAMDVNYKVFVHVLDRKETIVAQWDGMPRNWSYPTSQWGRGEVFVDRIEIDLHGVEPGTYGLAVGVYEPDGDRLPVARSADGRARLPHPLEVAR